MTNKQYIEEKVKIIRCAFVNNPPMFGYTNGEDYASATIDRHIEEIITILQFDKDNEREKIKQIVIEDVPHQYQERLLKILNK